MASSKTSKIYFKTPLVDKIKIILIPFNVFSVYVKYVIFSLILLNITCIYNFLFLYLRHICILKGYKDFLVCISRHFRALAVTCSSKNYFKLIFIYSMK